VNIVQSTVRRDKCRLKILRRELCRDVEQRAEHLQAQETEVQPRQTLTLSSESPTGETTEDAELPATGGSSSERLGGNGARTWRKLRTEPSSHIQRSRHRGSSAGASGSDTSGVTTRHWGVSLAAAPAAARRRGRSSGGGGGGLVLLLHERGRRVFLGVGASSAGSGGSCSSFSGGAASASSCCSGEPGEAPSPPLAAGMEGSDRGSASA
jgi:hypothetical protein